MQELTSWLCGGWVGGGGEPAVLVNPADGEALARTRTEGLDLGAAVRYARETGGPALRATTFAERAALLDAMSRSLHGAREELLSISVANGGNTRGDAKFDVDGATGTLAAYARLGAGLGDRKLLPDGEGVPLARSPRYQGRHVLVPREGVAVLVNAFNFPAWGFAEKAACALLAGMPVIVKPATSTALLAWRIARVLDESGVLPPGAVQLVCGSPGDLLDHLLEGDVVAFTGSADTGRRLRAHPGLLARSVPVSVEADSLNAAVLAPDAEPGGDTFRLFVSDVLREMTQKAGQKCTAVRRVIVPEPLLGAVEEELVAGLRAVVVGDPALREVRMGPLSTARQLADAREGLGLLAGEADVLTGGSGPAETVGEGTGRGFFLAPTLLRARDAEAAAVVNEVEVFGPVATLLPWDGSPGGAVELVRRGRGCLVSGAYGDDPHWLAAAVEGLAAWNGRLCLGSAKVADLATGSGVALPWLRHGGPGRAGEGHELGGLAGLRPYQQRCALQGDAGVLRRLLGE